MHGVTFHLTGLKPGFSQTFKSSQIHDKSSKNFELTVEITMMVRLYTFLFTVKMFEKLVET